MLEIRPFTPADLDVVTALAREQDFAPGIGDIEICLLYTSPSPRDRG